MSSDRYAPRVAGAAFLFLIATVLASGLLWNGLGTPPGTSETLLSISEASSRIRLSLVLTIVGGITTLVLAATLYAVVARQDRNLAILALTCRAVEGGLYAVGILDTLLLLSLSRGHANDPSPVQALTDLLMDVSWMSTNVGATFFAMGSTLYCYLLLKGRSIPVAISAVGLVGSLILLVGVPLQTALSQPTFAGASAAIWVPMIIFEIVAGGWLLVKGAKVNGAEPVPHMERQSDVGRYA